MKDRKQDRQSAAFPYVATCQGHLDFCEKLLTYKRRMQSGFYSWTERVFARVVSLTHYHSRYNKTVVSTNTINSLQQPITIAPRVNITLQSMTQNTGPVPLTAVAVKRPHTTPINKTGSVTPGFTHISKVPSGIGQQVTNQSRIRPVLQHVVERKYLKEMTDSRQYITTSKQCDFQRVERIVKRNLVTSLVSEKPNYEINKHSEKQPHKQWPMHSPVQSTLADIPENEVVRFTDRVVQQINRRILSERERLGRI